MVSSTATTVEGYLASLPLERRRVVSAVRDVVRERLPHGYRESMAWGMIGYIIPLERYPDNDQGDAQRLRDAFERAGKRLDMGKSCLRFQSLDDLPLPAIGELIASVPPEEFIARYERTRAARTAPRKRR